jgi:hypothetical protein
MMIQIDIQIIKGNHGEERQKRPLEATAVHGTYLNNNDDPESNPLKDSVAR